MNVYYHPCKANVVANALRSKSMGNTTHVEDEMKELVNDVHRLVRLGDLLVDSTSGGVSSHPSYESSLVVKVKQGQHLDPVVIKLNDSVLINMNVFPFGR